MSLYRNWRMATNEGYWKHYSAYRTRDNTREVIAATFIKMRKDNINLGSVDSCLALGTGDGDKEVEFIKEFAANIGKLVAVEPDHHSVEHLKVHLGKSLPVPGVDSQVCETDVESWEGPDDTVHLVLMFLVIYYVSPSKRKELYKKIRDHWLAAEGIVVIISPDSGTLQRIFERLGGRAVLTWEEVEADMLQVGFIKQHAYGMQTVHDLSDPDQSLRRFFEMVVGRPLTLDGICAAIKDLCPEGKTAGFYQLAIFKRQ